MSSNINIFNKIKIIYAEDDTLTRDTLNSILKKLDFIEVVVTTVI